MGGEIQMVEVSALNGSGIKELLEAVSLEAEVLDLKAHHDGPAFGVVLDSTTEVGKGAVATVLVQKGTLKKGDMILVGEHTKRVRSLVDVYGNVLTNAGPSVPASITGLDVPPKAGDEFVVVTSEKMAMGHLFDGKATMVVGTHTHVPTSDHRIMEKGTAYQTDIGMCGDYNSVIGMNKENSLKKFLKDKTATDHFPAEGEGPLSGIIIEANPKTGLTKKISRFIDGGILIK